MIGVPLAMPLAIKIYFSQDRWHYMEMRFNGTAANNPGQIIQLKVTCIQRQIHCSYTM